MHGKLRLFAALLTLFLLAVLSCSEAECTTTTVCPTAMATAITTAKPIPTAFVSHVPTLSDGSAPTAVSTATAVPPRTAVPIMTVVPEPTEMSAPTAAPVGKTDRFFLLRRLGARVRAAFSSGTHLRAEIPVQALGMRIKHSFSFRSSVRENAGFKMLGMRIRASFIALSERLKVSKRTLVTRLGKQ